MGYIGGDTSDTCPGSYHVGVIGIDMKVPSAGGSAEAIFSLSCGPGIMKIVISDSKIPRCQLDKV